MGQILTGVLHTGAAALGCAALILAAAVSVSLLWDARRGK